jgi:hypothetical protein
VSPLPGVTYETRDSSGVSGPPLDTATACIAGLAGRGPTDGPRFCTTLAQFEAIYGGEVSYGWLWWAAKLFPQEGGAGVWFQRVVGPAAKVSTIKFADGSGDTLRADAVSPGAWGDSIKVKVVLTGDGIVVTVLYGGVVKEVSPALATNADAVAWSQFSSYIRLVDLGGADAVSAEKTLAGGDDDRASITDSHRTAALPLFTADLGPRQVLYPGATTTTVHTALLEHALSHNGTAVLDGADTHTAATHLAECATLRALGFPADCGSPFGPWITVPGPTAGTWKTVPPSIIEAAKMARRDLETFDPVIGVGNPNEPAAGVHNNAGVSRVATGLSQEAWSDSDREALNNAGFNVIRELYGQVVTYGFRTLADPTTRPLNVWLNNRRIDMAIIAKAMAVGEEFNFRQIDGRGRVLSEFGSALSGRVLMPYWEIGALFGDTPEEAFGVQTGEQVNPPEQLAEGEVRAEIDAARSPTNERTKLLYVKKELS